MFFDKLDSFPAVRTVFGKTHVFLLAGTMAYASESIENLRISWYLNCGQMPPVQSEWEIGYKLF